MRISFMIWLFYPWRNTFGCVVKPDVSLAVFNSTTETTEIFVEHLMKLLYVMLKNYR